jgi:hypothetical protein
MWGSFDPLGFIVVSRFRCPFGMDDLNPGLGSGDCSVRSKVGQRRGVAAEPSPPVDSVPVR